MTVSEHMTGWVDVGELGEYHQLAAHLIACAKTEGGATIDVTGAELPTTGYYVGGVGTVSMPSSELTEGNVEPWVIERAAEGARFLGVWVDVETGLVWLDECTHVAEWADARALGLLAGEIAVWDIAANDERRLAQDEC